MTNQAPINIQFGKAVWHSLATLFLLSAEITGFTSKTFAQKVQPVPPIMLSANGHLSYASDSLGNRVPDFSYCGYFASETRIPLVPVKVIVPSINGDATERIQAAIDYVASLPADANGNKGAVLLQKGIYKLQGRLILNSSGVVLRGCGTERTTLLAAGKDRETLLRITGGKCYSISEAHKVLQDYVAVNANKLTVDDVTGFKQGQSIFIRRLSTKAWIDLLGMNSFGGETEWLGWKEGERDIVWDRKISAIEGDTLVLDAPITTALDKTFGGALVSSYQWPSRISQIGIENLSIVSEFDPQNKKDEDHCWMGITFENARDCWVRQVFFRHLAGSAVAIYENASRITVEDCLSLEPVSEIGGWRRNSFFTAGQQTLFHNIYAEFGVHDFGTGFCAAGPNAFVQCESFLPYSFSGGLDSWAAGVLFDIVNVDGNALSFGNREQDGYGAGWSAANSVFWECSAARIECYRPPGADNYAFGAWAQFVGNGTWVSSNEHVKPRSLFYAQLSDRIGQNNIPDDPVIEITTNSTSAPSVELAAELTVLSEKPALTLIEWIKQHSERNKISIESENAPSIDQLKLKSKAAEIKLAPEMAIKNGWIVRGNKVLTGNRHSVPWWRGNLRPKEISMAKQAITRNVPGRYGLGYTDNLNEVVSWMKQNNYIGVEQNYGLWYERRRDDHERIRRMDGDAWAPFYELPFARSGEGLAWDGMSKYDLTKYNNWYWTRLRQFADQADENGLLLIHQNYFQHNIIEAGAHWVDFPWRSVNNINGTGFPEPPPFAGDKRIYMAEHFYDLSNPVRKELHRAYIRKCLDNFKDNNGVIQLTGFEFTGPLHFVRFWLETIQEWESETGKKEIIGLSVTQDIQDSILADPKLASVVDLIDIRYWYYREDGSAYAPLGGQSLAPRQQARLVKPGKTSFEQVYHAVHEYRLKFPDKAVMFSADGYDSYAWAVFMAGGSLADLPNVQVPGFLESVSGMSVVEGPGNGQYLLQNKNGESIIYLRKGKQTGLDLRNFKGKFRLLKINPDDGSIIGRQKIIDGGKVIPVEVSSGDEVLWITK
jgi:hypothetical protein